MVGLLLHTTVRGLYNGVSQQPPTLRLENQAEIQENAVSLLVDGLVKRSHTEHVKTLTNLPNVQEDSYIHFIDRDENERYFVCINKNGLINILTLDGTPCTISFEAGTQEYLKKNVQNPRLDFKLLSVADHTFIVNKRVVPKTLVLQNTGSSDEYPNTAIVFVKRGLVETTYTVTVIVDGKEYKAEYTVPIPDDGNAAGNTMADTEVIAERLEDGLKQKNIPKVVISREGSSIFIRGESDTTVFGVRGTDSYGDQAMDVVKGTVQKFTDLPPLALNGTRVTIQGDNGSTLGNFYVRYRTQDGGKGFWEETYRDRDDEGNLIPRELDPSTMPVKLVRTGHQAFTVMSIEWEPRLVGDDNSAPLPSFVGNPINDIFFFKNRLGFLSGDSVVLSEAGEYYNFFPSTVTEVLDGDPIDIHVQSNNVVTLTHAVPLSSSLLLFSAAQQFILSGTGILTPVTVSVDHNAYHNASSVCSPKAVGPSVFFVSPKGDYSAIREYYIQPDLTSNDADDVTAHVPNYIPNNIRHLEPHVGSNTLFVQSGNDTLYVYTYYWEGDQKVQSSWGRWVFPYRQILHVAAVDFWLYLITKDNLGNIFIERLNIEFGHEEFTKIQLDMRVEVTNGVYDSKTNTTTWTLPYDTTGKTIRLVDKETALEFTKIRTDGSQVSVTGDFSKSRCFAGVPYTFRYRFSPWYLRDEHGIAITQGHLQIRNIRLSFVDTGYFKLVVKDGKRLRETEYTAASLGSGLLLGRLEVRTGDKSFYVGGNARNVQIEIVSDSYLPCKFQVASYEGFYTSRARKY